MLVMYVISNNVISYIARKWHSLNILTCFDFDEILNLYYYNPKINYLTIFTFNFILMCTYFNVFNDMFFLLNDC